MFDDTAGAGFLNDQNNLDTPSQKKMKSDHKRMQNIFPVVIAQIYDCKTEEFTLFGQNVQMISIMGILRSQDVRSTKAIYEIEDHTGTISAVLWIEGDSDLGPVLPSVKVGSYVHAVGIVRTHDKIKNIMIMKMLPVRDINEPTTHLLKVLVASSEAKALATRTELPSAVKANNPGIQFANAMNFSSNAEGLSETGLTAFQDKIFKMFQTNKDSIGMSEQHILDKFPKNQHGDVRDQIDFLVNEGHIYSTVDDKHFKVTSSF